MIGRLQEQAQGLENYRERGQQAMANFDTDKAIQNGTEIAYRHGHALLQQGRQQLEAMAGTELVAGAHMALPPLYKTGKAIYDATRTKAEPAIGGASKIGGGPVDPESFLGRQQEMAMGRVRKLGGGGDGGDDDADILKYDTKSGTMINRATGETISDGRYDTSLQTGSGLRNDPTLRQAKIDRLSNPREPQQSYDPVPPRQDFDEGDMFTQRAGARNANIAYQQRASAEASAQAERDTINSLPSVDELSRDPQTVADRPAPATGEAPRPIEPQVQKPSIGTQPVEGEYTGATQPSRQYPQSRGEAQAPKAQPAPPPRDQIGGPDYVAPQAEKATLTPSTSLTAEPATQPTTLTPSTSLTAEPRTEGFGDNDLAKMMSSLGQAQRQERDTPAVAQQPAEGARAGPPIDDGNDTSRVGQSLPKNDEPYITKPPASTIASTAEETTAKVGGEEAVGGVLDAIPGLDLLGAAIGIAGIASAIHSDKKIQEPSAPVPQPIGTPSNSIAFDSAPVYDSSDYHNA